MNYVETATRCPGESSASPGCGVRVQFGDRGVDLGLHSGQLEHERQDTLATPQQVDELVTAPSQGNGVTADHQVRRRDRLPLDPQPIDDLAHGLQ